MGNLKAPDEGIVCLRIGVGSGKFKLKDLYFDL